MVPYCRTVADIGTDHGYLPIYLVKKGICEKAVAADVNEGPLSSAERNIKEASLKEKIKAVLSDGLENITSVDCITIAGMGGELICEILKRRKDGQEHFVMQPQRSPDKLRIYLAKNGFMIKKEAIAKEGDKMYCAFYAVYTGESCDITEAEALLGKTELLKGDPLYTEYILYRRRQVALALEAIEKAGADSERKKELLRIIAIYDCLLEETA